VVACMGLRGIPISNKHDVCFDAVASGVGGDTYFEVKSVRKGNKSPLYVWRLKKDLDAGVHLVYLFAKHNTKGSRTFAELYTGMQDTLKSLLRCG